MRAAIIMLSLVSLAFSLTTHSEGFLAQPDDGVSVTPQYFDLREIYYSSCKFHIYEEGVCTGNWALSVADAISDVLCIKKKGSDRLSVQQLVDCVHSKDNTCKNSTNAALLRDSLSFVQANGLTTSACYSYKSGFTGKAGSTCSKSCDDKSAITKVYKIAGFKKLNTKEEIKEFILKQGSVIANIRYYSDLLLYTKGMYIPDKTTEYLGYHTVKLVGWNIDEDDGNQEYWIVANSFGMNWGTKGYFHIKTDGDLIFEAYGVTLA